MVLVRVWGGGGGFVGFTLLRGPGILVAGFACRVYRFRV